MGELTEDAAELKKQFTATGYVVSADRSRMLMIFHRGLTLWLPPGGHVDPDEFPGDTALREVWEETGVRARHAGTHTLDLGAGGRKEMQLPTPFAMAAQRIPPSPKDPEEHIHMDLMYRLEADDDAPLTAAEAEVSDVGWFTREQIDQLDTTESVRRFAHAQLL
ncbi:NUDIX domain-containing protein [Nesterenkonia massiliensis]|uniref:NUDIX domain-containing protein n=1 Tax=Nesterenkonia massiliensis TaxID=1232429 RepID=A0ABT2HQW4_9MICC|nr:NUDIX domain-containing protein [Nesterenkonia massiliensis]MCT1607089.1 NUDIX domain-containing protein [Nesterenkonia massiliensis]